MNAQTIINASEIKRDNLKFFYPELYQQKEADLNITKCLRELKEGIR